MDVISEAGARRELVAESELNRILAEEIDGRIVGVRGNLFGLSADAEVQRQLVIQPPLVLNEESVDVRRDVALRDEALFGRDRVARHLVIAERPLERPAGWIGRALAPVERHDVLEVAAVDVLAA